MYLIPKLKSQLKAYKNLTLKQLQEISRQYKELFQNPQNKFEPMAALERMVMKQRDMSEEEIELTMKKIIFRLADYLFDKNQTLMDIVHKKICDKVIDGKEYQLIRRNDLINIFDRLGIKMNLKERYVFKNLIKPVVQTNNENREFIDIETIQSVLGELGIFECSLF